MASEPKYVAAECALGCLRNEPECVGCLRAALTETRAELETAEGERDLWRRRFERYDVLLQRADAQISDLLLERFRLGFSANPQERGDQRELNEIVLDREELKFGKYTRSYAKLSSEQMEGLLWLLGEWTIRGDNDHPRSVAAKKALLEFHQEPLSKQQVHELIRGLDSVVEVR